MEEAWKRFEQSGSIADYLDYSRKKQTGVAGLDAVPFLLHANPLLMVSLLFFPAKIITSMPWR